MRKFLKLSCVILLLLGGCADKTPEMNYCTIDCVEADMSEYSSLEGVEHVFYDTTYEEALEYLQDETFSGILYYGYPACPWCEEAVVEMNTSAKKLDLTIYYVNKKSDFNIKHPELEEKTALHLNQYYDLDKDEEGKPHLYVPEVVVVDQGNVIDHHLGTLDEHNAHEREMSADEKVQLQNIYDNMFSKLK